MNTADQLRTLVNQIVENWADKGQVIEGGWLAFAAMKYPCASADTLREIRTAYYLGAQHLFACIIGFLNADKEPTEQDMWRMSLVHEELERFRMSLVN